MTDRLQCNTQGSKQSVALAQVLVVITLIREAMRTSGSLKMQPDLHFFLCLTSVLS